MEINCSRSTAIIKDSSNNSIIKDSATQALGVERKRLDTDAIGKVIHDGLGSWSHRFGGEPLDRRLGGAEDKCWGLRGSDQSTSAAKDISCAQKKPQARPHATISK